MAEVRSTFHLAPGQPAPDFSLPDASGRPHRLSELWDGAAGIIIVFACNHCPFVIHLASALGTFAREMAERGIRTVAISSNDVAKYPADAPSKMLEFAAAHGWDFPYLYDESQAVAQAYAAACTPDFYLFDATGCLTYAGEFDETRPGRGGAATGTALRSACDLLLKGEPVLAPWYPSSGCNIKWKPGGEPSYFG
jgi:peroxiredoxin